MSEGQDSRPIEFGEGISVEESQISISEDFELLLYFAALYADNVERKSGMEKSALGSLLTYIFKCTDDKRILALLPENAVVDRLRPDADGYNSEENKETIELLSELGILPEGLSYASQA